MTGYETITSDLEQLCGACGVAGHPAAAQAAAELLRPLTDECRTDTIGNVLAVRRSTRADAPVILLEAHLDEIGFLVTDIDDLGFVHVAAAGGIDTRALAAQPVQVHGDALYSGVFCSVPPHLIREDSALPALENMGIDIGMTAEQAREHVPLGSRVGFAPCFCRLNEHTVSSKALDDRAGCAAILHCLRQLKETAATVVVSFSAQEEIGSRGAGLAARQLRPCVALATDVSFALAPEEKPHECGKLGGGVMIGISPVLDTAVSARLQQLAAQKAIPAQTEVMGGRTGTDADMISNEGCGIPTGLLSIPQRYMHTPVEIVDIRDIAATGDLMAAYVQNCVEEVRKYHG